MSKIDFGNRCLNCKNFKQTMSNDAFGKCIEPNSTALGKVHKFTGCDMFVGKALNELLAANHPIDFDYARKKWQEEKFLTK